MNTFSKSNLVFAFDLDYTLVQTNEANNNSYRDALCAVAGIKLIINNGERFTRDNLYESQYINLTPSQRAEVSDCKDRIFTRYLHTTVLNENLVHLLKALHDNGNETLLLTDSRKSRANQICKFYGLEKCFSKRYYREDYSQNKYQHLLQQGIDMNHVVLFENEVESQNKAIQNGICRNNIIKVDF